MLRVLKLHLKRIIDNISRITPVQEGLTLGELESPNLKGTFC